MIKARRIRHATVTTADLERQIDYFQSVVGLGVAQREAGRVLMSSDSEQLSLVLVQAGQASVPKLAFEVAPGSDFVGMQRALSDKGLKAELRSDDLPGVAQSLVMTDHEGMQIELMENAKTLPAQAPIGGLAVNKLGHVAMYTNDPQATSTFYGEVLGFRVSDWIEENFVFMRCGFDHHTLNFARGDGRRLHHIAFELRDAAHMHQACDLLGRKRTEILWGPVRHGPGHNVAIYHRNPDGQLVELFFDMDRMADEELIGHYVA
ncbi:MAG: glyoxalase, partial [Bradyrhizobium sp. 35-63-5]